ncbi:hypothetical protein LMG28614_05640 [Paraburkholderia ultramafica]|uniref:Uncharacterized protein n=1 Tax=Paraburkholderia ultramafica TaxID=1544867 RepID=A0A6S7BK38_9BURK|nr:hypothetical protein [Paraburkholderia ultramafica]CAB3802556.1 hypothetical protein LMG28614_05640 [Paraburkholderia ultramafica]
MKAYSAVSLLFFVFVVAAANFCVNWISNTCPHLGWCESWVMEPVSTTVALAWLVAVLGTVVLLVMVAIHGRSMRGKPFNTGATVAQHYEASKPMFWGAMGVFYALKLIAWGSLPSDLLALYAAALFAGIIGFFSLLQLLSGLWHLLCFLALEAKGMEWDGAESGGNQLFRVCYRRGDGSGLVSLATREQRSVEELNYNRKRRFSTICYPVALVAAFLGRPDAYQYSEYVGWALTYLVLPPLCARVATDLIYTLAYHCGGQFIPAAKVVEPPRARIDPKELMVGLPDATVENPADVVKQLSNMHRS